MMEGLLRLLTAVFLLWTALSSAYAKSLAGLFGIIGQGKCPQPGVQKDFDVHRYAGEWFAYARYDLPAATGTKCGGAKLKVKKDGSVGIVNSHLRDVNILGFTLLQIEASVNGELTPIDGARMSLSYSGYKDLNRPNFFIVETDYDNYAVVMACLQFPMAPFHIQNLVIVTRKRGVAPAHYDEIKARLEHAHVPVDKLRLEDQTGCHCPVTAALEAQKHEDGHHEEGHHEDGHHEEGHHEEGHHENGHHEDEHHEDEHHEDGHHEEGNHEEGHHEEGHHEDGHHEEGHHEEGHHEEGHHAVPAEAVADSGESP